MAKITKPLKPKTEGEGEVAIGENGRSAAVVVDGDTEAVPEAELEGAGLVLPEISPIDEIESHRISERGIGAKQREIVAMEIME